MDSLFPLIIVIAIIVVFLIWTKSNASERKGAAGESSVAAIVSSEIRKGFNGYVLKNVYVPREDGSTSEIDVLLVSTKGLFVFESKNYAGYIFGNDQQRKWTVTLYAGKSRIGFKQTEKHSFYNPVWQNKTHIKALKNLTKTTAPIYSIVVFSTRGKLMNVTYDSDKVKVLQSNELHIYLSKVRYSYPEVLSTEEVERLSKNLSLYTRSDESVRQAHLESIRKKYLIPETCPWCGSKLVIRTARKGQNVGKQFYGCSNYPKCKYTRNIKKYNN